MDKTTVKRYALVLDEASEIRDGYHGCLDYTQTMPEELARDIEQKVTDWLDDSGIESTCKEFNLLDKDGKDLSRNLTFYRSEIALKTCSNNWLVIHIAESSSWPRLLSSKPKLTIQRSGGDYFRFNNEIRSTNYDNSSEAQVRQAQAIYDEPVLTIADGSITDTDTDKNP